MYIRYKAALFLTHRQVMNILIAEAFLKGKTNKKPGKQWRQYDNGVPERISIERINK